METSRRRATRHDPRDELVTSCLQGEQQEKETHPKSDGGTELLNTRKQAGDSKRTLCKHSKDKKMECLPLRMTGHKYLIAELRFLVTEHRSSTKQGRIPNTRTLTSGKYEFRLNVLTFYMRCWRQAIVVDDCRQECRTGTET